MKCPLMIAFGWGTLVLSMTLSDLAWGEVTVVGSNWKSQPVLTSEDSDSSKQAASPSDKTTTQPSADENPTGWKGALKLLAKGPYGSVDDSFRYLSDEDLWNPQEGLDTAIEQPPRGWTIGYQFHAICDGDIISSQFNPSRSMCHQLVLPLNSCWHGLEVGLQKEKWDIHFEWSMPQQGIQGENEILGWYLPKQSGLYTDLGFSRERWDEGQMLDFRLARKLTDHFLRWPIEIWPAGGFRWQRLDIVCHDLTLYKEGNHTLNPPATVPGDVFSFNQEYNIFYLGGQLRTKLEPVRLPPLVLTFQGDWGYVSAYNANNDLLNVGNHEIEITHGSSWHVALTVEALINKNFSLGFQADHTELRTRGDLRFVNDSRHSSTTWDDCAAVSSDQTWLMAFLRLRF